MAWEEIDLPPPNPKADELAQRIVEAADLVELRPEGALWLYEAEEKEWRFYLVTSLLEEKGPLWVYRKMLQAFSKVDFPKEVDKLSLRLCSPREPAMAHLAATYKVSESHIVVINSQINDVTIDGALIYRLLPPRPRKQVLDNVVRFERRVEQLMAA